MKSALFGCALVASIGSVAFAQDSGGSGGLEEIVVTATRRSQDLQEVPVSIVAITGESMETRGIQNLEDVGAAIPNLNIQGGGGGTAQTQFRVRGIPNVGTYIDGVWQVGSNGFLTQEFTDIDRVEVLRGPQGTTFGRDSTGGAIRIWTKKPSADYAADIAATVGTLDRRDVRLSVDVPVTDKFLTKWTAASFYRDGYIQDLTVNQKNGGIDQQVYRGDMLWTPTDKLSLRFQYATDNSMFTEPRIQDGIFNTAAQQGQQILITQFYGLAGAEPFDNIHETAGYAGGQVGKWQNKSKITLPTHIQHRQASMDVQWQLSDSMSLQFLTAGTEEVNDTYVDWDNSPYDIVDDLNRSKLRVFSEEIQLSGQRDRLSWFGGLYYWDQGSRNRNGRFVIEEFTDGTLDVNNVFNSPTCMAMVPNSKGNCQDVYANTLNQRYDTLSRSNTNGYAAFGEVTINLSSSLDLIAGLRYHNQDSDTQALAITGAAKPLTTNVLHTPGADIFQGNPIGVPTKVNFDKLTKKLALQKQFRQGLMGYISYAEGFDSGGVSTPTVNGVRQEYPYAPQTLENSEIGMRSDWADGKLRFNATLFHMIWKDIQNVGVVFDAQGNQLPTLVTTNVGEALSQGLEAELSIVPTDHFLINVNLGLLDTKYTNIAAGTFALNTSTEFQQAPKTTYNLGFQYTADLQKGSTLTTRLDYSYSSQFWRSLPFLRMSWYSAVPANYDESGNIGTLNARMTFEPGSKAYTLSVFGTNLTNEYLLNSGFFHGIWGYDFATVARPREAGVSFNFHF